jgi:hypothetical protein
VTAAARAVPVLILAGCAAWAARDPISTASLHARWAWNCRGRPVPGDGEKLTREEIQARGNLAAGRDVRSRT